jgi:hypothetical protein
MVARLCGLWARDEQGHHGSSKRLPEEIGDQVNLQRSTPVTYFLQLSSTS